MYLCHMPFGPLVWPLHWSKPSEP